jgi:protein SCO1/2
MDHRPRLTGLLFGSLLLICPAGCRRFGNSTDASGLNAIHYPVHGVVLGKSPLSQEVTIEQAPVPRRMPATSAVYRIPESGLFWSLQTGDSIAGEAYLPENGNPNELRNAAVLSETRNPQVVAALPSHMLLEGESLQSIPMLNEDRKQVDLTQFRGKAVLVTFVDTQCTEDCPIITKLFGEVNRLLAENPKVYLQSVLVTVSLDPAHDTPSVLRRYGLQYLHGDARGFDHWEFVTLTPANLNRLATSFGVLYQASKDGDIEHTMCVSLIGPNNTLIQSWDGDDWHPAVIANAVDAAVTGRSS